MEFLKEDMEEECRKLQDNLRELMEDKGVLQQEFIQLNGLQKRMMIQLKEDTLAGEGQLHSFQSEKLRVEARLEQLEEQMRDKNEKLMALDAKASEYLLKVTTASNSIYDEEEVSEQNESQKNLIKRLVSEEMLNCEEEDADAAESLSATEDASVKNISSLQNDENGELSSDNISEVASDHDVKVDSQKSFSPPTKDQILSLSTLVSELKRVKDDMGKAIADKSDSFHVLENQLLETKRELASLKGSMSDVSFGIRHKDDEVGSLDRIGDIRKSGIEKQVSDLQEATGQSSLPHHEKLDLLQKIEILESMIEDDQNPTIEVGDFTTLHLLDARMRESRDFGSAFFKPRTPMMSNSISEKVAFLERDLEDANERLNQAHFHIKGLTKEKEHKQNECTLLRDKVNKVESKMSELQTTFDALIKNMMEERDQLVKDNETKTEKLEQLDKKTSVDLEFYILKEEMEEKLTNSSEEMEEKLTNSSEESKKMKRQLSSLENDNAIQVKHISENKKEIEALLSKLKSEQEKHEKEVQNLIAKEDQLKANIESLKFENEWNARNRQIASFPEYIQLQQEFEDYKNNSQQMPPEVEEMKESLQVTTKENEELKEKVSQLESELSDFAPTMKEEMSRIKEELSKTTEDKLNFEKLFYDLQDENRMTIETIEELSAKIESLEKDKLEVLSVKQQIEDLNFKNMNLTTEMYSKEEEAQEELIAREATIQELRITLTNNQKQSRENYQMLQDDIAALHIKHDRERDESQAIIAHLKEKVLFSEEVTRQKQEEIERLKNGTEIQMGQSLAVSETKIDSQTSEEFAAQSIDNLMREIMDNSPEDVQTTEKATSVDRDNNLVSPSISASSSSESPNWKDHPEFKQFLSSKEEEIQELSSKIKELEKDYQEKTRVFKEDGHLSQFEAQMKQIADLNNFIDELKIKVEQLSSESASLNKAIAQLQIEKSTINEEKQSLLENLKKVQQESSSSEGNEKCALTDNEKHCLLEKLNETQETYNAEKQQYEAKLFELGKQKEELEKEKLSLTEKLNEAQEALNVEKKQWETKMNNLDKDKEVIEDEKESVIKELVENVEISSIKNKELEESVNLLKKEKELIDLSKEDLKLKLQDAQSESEAKLTNLEDMVSKLKAEISDALTEKESLVHQMNADHKVLQADNEDRKNICDKLNEEKEIVAKEKQALENKLEEIEKSYEDEKENNTNLINKISEEKVSAEKEVKSLLEKLNEEQKTSSAKLEQCTDEKETMSNEVSSLQTKLRDLQQLLEVEKEKSRNLLGRLREEKETLENEKKSLLKKLSDIEKLCEAEKEEQKLREDSLEAELGEQKNLTEGAQHGRFE